MSAGTPTDAALLPPEEKAKLIVELRQRGKTYREIQRALKVSPRDVSRALRTELHRDEIESLRQRVEKLEDGLHRIENTLTKLDAFRQNVEEIEQWLELGLSRMFRASPCIHMRGGFCEAWVWKKPVRGWSMKKTKDGYVLNVERHRWMCALCPTYTSKEHADTFKRVLSLAEGTEKLVAMLGKTGWGTRTP